jgi:hypothetical protein
MKIMQATSCRIVLFVVVCSSLTMFSLCSNKIYTGTENVSVVDTSHSRNSFISYVLINGLMYIFKQKKDPSKQFSVVRDALAAYIAQDLSIAHSVEIVSLKKDFPAKIHAMSPGAILTIARGATVRDQPESRYYNLSLKQRNLNGDLLPHRWLTEQIIYQITWHKQLPIIIGLDLFLCNTDRHGGNLFYDPQTDSFCAIDMDNIFRRDLPALACAKLQAMIANKKQFTQEEIEALTSVRDTIQFLLDRYTAKHLIAQLHVFIKQAGFKKKLLRTEKMTKKIARHEATIKESRASAYKLIGLLNKIINNF